MEYLLVGFIAFSVTLNLMLVWQVLRQSKVEYFPCELLPTKPEESDDVTVTLSAEPDNDSVTKREQPQPALQAANHQAWNNRKNIPWSELDRPRQEPVRSHQSGPLERPPGFSR